MYINGGVLFSDNTSNRFTMRDTTTPAITKKYVITTAVRGLWDTIITTPINAHLPHKEVTKEKSHHHGSMTPYEHHY